MAHNTDKTIVSNRSVLLRKYQKMGLEQIEAGVRNLIAADARRGINSKLIYLDDRSIRGFRAIPVRHSNSGHEYKNAIDALYRWFKPDYVMILGSSEGRHRNFSKLAKENGLRKFKTSIFSYGSGKQEREKHFVYYENPDSRKGRKRPPAIVFKESDGQIEVRVYVPK